MSTSLKRKTLLGGAVVMGLLGGLHTPVTLAGEREHSSAAHETNGKQASQRQEGQGENKQEMEHGTMDRDSMNHGDMDHEKMMQEHGGDKAEAGSNHDH